MQDPYDYFECQNYPHNQFNYGPFKPFPTPIGWGFSGSNDLLQTSDEANKNDILFNNSNTEFNLPDQIDPSLINSCLSTSDWDIKDAILPKPEFYHSFDMWPDGDCHMIYSASNIKSRKHKSGWAMRNTNNHNKMILKKSCLGVIKCSKGCWYPNQNSSVRIAPKISEAARRCQLNNKPCPNASCDGSLIQQTCTGKSGNPVTHYWRYYQPNNCIYFMARGTHDHERPNIQVKKNDKKLKSIKNYNDAIEFASSGYGDKYETKYVMNKYGNMARNHTDIFNINLEYMYPSNRMCQQLMLHQPSDTFQPDKLNNKYYQYISPIYNSSVSNSTESGTETWSTLNGMISNSDISNNNVPPIYGQDFSFEESMNNSIDYFSRSNIPFDISWNNECSYVDEKIERGKECLFPCQEVDDSIIIKQISNVNKFSFRNELEMDCFAE